MTNIELRTRSIFDQLNNSEKKVASYFLANVDSVFNQPIAQLAAASGVSQVAWVRFCKRIGFYGLKDLKKSLFSELNDAQQASGVSHSESYADIKDHTTVQQIKDTVKNSSIQAIENTMQLLDCEAVQKAAQNLISADSIKIFGVGASALVSEDLYNRLLRIGKNVCFCRDLHVQLTYASNMTPRDVGVFISNSGRTQEILETFTHAKNCGAKTVALTKYGQNALAESADFVLSVSAPEVDKRSGAMSSRIAQLAVIDVLFTAVANLDYATVEAKLENSYESLRSHKVN